MIRLDATTKILQLIATATADVTVSGLAVTTAAAPGFSQETAATATTQTICSAPSVSQVKQFDRIFIKNGGSANTLTVQTYNSSGPATTIQGYIVLAANESYEWTHARGSETKDASGVVKTSVTFAGLVVASGKTLTVSNTLTLAGTDGSTLSIGAGGTLGTAAYTAASAYEASGAIATHAALQTGVHGLAITAAKTLTVSKSMSFTAADDAGVYTFPTGPASLARIDAAQTFAGVQTFSTSISTPSIITASGALGITPAAGSGVNINLSTTGDFAVNTDQLYVDTSTGNVGLGIFPAAKLHIPSGTVYFGGNLQAVGGITAAPFFFGSNDVGFRTDQAGKAFYYNSGAANAVKLQLTPGINDFTGLASTVNIDSAGVSYFNGGSVVIGAVSPTAGSKLTVVGIIDTTDTTDATSATAASLKTAGGIAAVKGLWVGTTSRLVGNVQIDGALAVTGVAKLSGGYTVAGLPAGTIGQRAYVTNALAPTYMTTVVEGGAVVTPVFHNGTNWVAE